MSLTILIMLAIVLLISIILGLLFTF